MTYRGHVKDGQILLDQQAQLPEGAQVSVQVIAPSANRGDRRQIIALPLERRRELLREQSERLADHYLASQGNRICAFSPLPVLRERLGEGSKQHTLAIGSAA